MKIRLHSGAKRDFDDAVHHYAAIRPELAGRFIDEVNAGFDQIIQDPQRWRVVGGSVRRVLTEKFPFALLYIIEGDAAHIVAVAHSSREALYRALSAKGNPTLKTILAVLKAVGMRLSVEQGEHAPA